LPCGVDAALHSGHSEGGNFDVAPYGNCNERDFDFGSNGDFGNSGDYSADGGFDDTARPAAGDRDVEFGERHVHYADGHLDVEAGAFQDARGCSAGDDERGACAGADAECREAAAHYADERDGARGWSSTDEGGEDFCVNARDDAREWSGTDAGGEEARAAPTATAARRLWGCGRGVPRSRGALRRRARRRARVEQH